MLVKFNNKTLIHIQSSSSMANRVKPNTFNLLNFSWKGFKSREERIDACEKVSLKSLIHYQTSSSIA